MSSQARAPRFSSSRNGETITISHTEYVQDIVGSSLFTAYSLPINPGDTSVFPWLSGMVSNWEKYRFKHLSYSYRPTCSSTTNGSLAFGVDFDETDTDPITKPTLLGFQGVTSGPAWQPKRTANVTHGNDPNLWRYIRFNTATLANEDPRVNDTGKIIVGTSGFNTTGDVGELWVTYTVELSVPQLYSSAEQRCIIVNNSPSPSLPFGGSTTTQGSLRIDLGSDKYTLIFRDAGSYLLRFLMSGTGLAADTIPVIGVGTGTALIPTSVLGTYIDSTGTHGQVMHEVLVTETEIGGSFEAWVDYDFSPITATLASLVCFISRLPINNGSPSLPTKRVAVDKSQRRECKDDSHINGPPGGPKILRTPSLVTQTNSLVVAPEDHSDLSPGDGWVRAPKGKSLG